MLTRVKSQCQLQSYVSKSRAWRSYARFRMRRTEILFTWHVTWIRKPWVRSLYSLPSRRIEITFSFFLNRAVPVIREILKPRATWNRGVLFSDKPERDPPLPFRQRGLLYVHYNNVQQAKYLETSRQWPKFHLAEMGHRIQKISLDSWTSRGEIQICFPHCRATPGRFEGTELVSRAEQVCFISGTLQERILRASTLCRRIKNSSAVLSG